MKNSKTERIYIENERLVKEILEVTDNSIIREKILPSNNELYLSTLEMKKEIEFLERERGYKNLYHDTLIKLLNGKASIQDAKIIISKDEHFEIDKIYGLMRVIKSDSLVGTEESGSFSAIRDAYNTLNTNI